MLPWWLEVVQKSVRHANHLYFYETEYRCFDGDERFGQCGCGNDENTDFLSDVL